jgi:hypothetical protein
LSEACEIRILVPCGHVLCNECAQSHGVRCPVSKCRRNVAKVSKPCIQEGDPMDEKAEVSNRL